MAEAKKSEGKPIAADVAKPGKSAPSTTSKPVLISNRPILKDPMVVTKDDDPEVGKAPAETASATEAVATALTPTKTTETKLEPDTTDTTTDTTTKKAEDKIDDKVEAAKPEPKAASTDDKPSVETPATKESGVDKSKLDDDSDEEAENDPTSQTPEAVDAEAAKQAEHDAAIQKLVDGKQYFLPINSVEKRKTKRFVILGLVLSIILVAAWADIALDAGLIHVNGVKPVTHFFSN